MGAGASSHGEGGREGPNHAVNRKQRSAPQLMRQVTDKLTSAALRWDSSSNLRGPRSVEFVAEDAHAVGGATGVRRCVSSPKPSGSWEVRSLAMHGSEGSVDAEKRRAAAAKSGGAIMTVAKAASIMKRTVGIGIRERWEREEDRDQLDSVIDNLDVQGEPQFQHYPGATSPWQPPSNPQYPPCPSAPPCLT